MEYPTPRPKLNQKETNEYFNRGIGQLGTPRNQINLERNIDSNSNNFLRAIIRVWRG